MPAKTARPPRPQSRRNRRRRLRPLCEDFTATLQGTAKNRHGRDEPDSADPHALVQALTKPTWPSETAVTVRDKVVEAYQEKLRMPV